MRPLQSNQPPPPPLLPMRPLLQPNPVKTLITRFMPCTTTRTSLSSNTTSMKKILVAIISSRAPMFSALPSTPSLTSNHTLHLLSSPPHYFLLHCTSIFPSSFPYLWCIFISLPFFPFRFSLIFLGALCI
ncbi:hypothetical protein BCR43DRAFT_485047 [Syncephalastrum racemosum]|uniref:Uncharacterized protein n=1 Tax=Syncephalastrum racemosum TaxID=13706 RepID=A0A1X2HN91_SYNRA|nr:hypothetical protein BCR43DRAFT_485047 [Syncephalastrum racemosum]